MGVISRTNPSGTTVWGIQYIDDRGKRRRRYDDRWTKAQAKREFTEIERRLMAGVAPQSDMTVADLYAEWFAHHVQINCSPSYAHDCRSQWRLRIEPMIGHRRIDTVTRRVVRQMVVEMKRVFIASHPGNEYAGHRTINKALTIVKGMFSYAVGIDQLAMNPAHGVPELAEEPQRQIDAWPLEVVHAVAKEAERAGDSLPDFQRGQRAPWAGQRDYTIIMLAAFTGLRQSELLGLTWSQIDGDWIHVTHKLCRRSFTLRETKSRRGKRRVPMLPATRKLVEEWRAVGAHPTIVFPSHEGDAFIRAEHFSNGVWRKSRRRAGTITVAGKEYDGNRMTFHELRHTFISLCLAAGRDVWEVAHWAGDDPDLVKSVYGHYIPDSLGDVSRLAAAISVPRSC